jgi:hypothetical protein
MKRAGQPALFIFTAVAMSASFPLYEVFYAERHRYHWYTARSWLISTLVELWGGARSIL